MFGLSKPINFFWLVRSSLSSFSLHVVVILAAMIPFFSVSSCVRRT